MTISFDRDVYCLLGLPFDAVDLKETVRRIRHAAQKRQQFFFSTPNLNWVTSCITDKRFRDSVIYSDLSIVDGMPLVWIARSLGIPIRERIAGANVFEVLRNSTVECISVFFFGGSEAAGKSACKRLNEESLGLICAGFDSPGFGTVDTMSSDRIIDKINAANADFLVVSLGSKKGQEWILRNRKKLTPPVISYFGAVLNFAAGTIRRAPVWMQKSGLEWLWRIKEEPKLWRRYSGDAIALLTLFTTRVLPYAWFLLRSKADAHQLTTNSINVLDNGNIFIVRLKGVWTRKNLVDLRECFSKLALGGKNVRLEMQEVKNVDSAFVALVMLLESHQRQYGKRLYFVSVPKPVCRVIKYCCAEYLLSDNI